MNLVVPFVVVGILAVATIATVVFGMSFQGNQQSKKEREEEQRRKEKEKEEEQRRRERKNEEEERREREIKEEQRKMEREKEAEERRREREREEGCSNQDLDEYSRIAADVEASMKERYKMDSNPRGFCLIVNNKNFGCTSRNRDWSEIDEERLEKLFKDDLLFTVSVRRDLRREEMLDLAIQFSQKDHSKCDAFVFIIMSHGGNRDTVSGVDHKSIEIEELMSKFTPTYCPSLANKPKLFFIQACRGELEERLLSNRSDASSDAIRGLSDSTLPRSVCPNETDFLLSFATAPGYKAFRIARVGSLFIQILVDSIRKHHRDQHLLDILTIVNRLVVNQGNQVPAPIHTLQKDLWL